MSKSNQLTRVLQLHLGKSMNLARIRFLSLIILALNKVQSVNFEKLATVFDLKAKRESSLRRIQRFISQYALPLDLVARLIFNLITPQVSSINHVQFIPESFIIHENECYLSALCFINDKGQKDLLVIISLENNHNSLELYRDRWQIETMFRGFKSSGFNIEATHLRDIRRVEKLLAIVMIAFTWAYITGVYRSEYLKEIKIMKHGRKAKSFFKYGLEFIVQALMNPNKSKLFGIALKILSCTKPKHLKKIHYIDFYLLIISL